MKKTFRAAIAVLFVLAFAVVGMSSAMSVSAVKVPTFKQPNLALNTTGAKAFVSEQGSGKNASNANDGKYMGTDGYTENGNYAQTAVKAGQYLGIYFGKDAKDFDTVVVRFDTDGMKDIEKIEYTKSSVEPTINEKGECSIDSTGWTTLTKDKGMSIETYELEKVVKFDTPANANFLKITLKVDTGDCGSSAEVAEIEVFDYSKIPLPTEATNLAFKSAATASTSADDLPASNVTDGKEDSYWQSNSETAIGDYITVDLGKTMDVAKLRLIWGGGAADKYSVTISQDGITYSNPIGFHRERSGGYPRIEDILTLNETVSARYIRVTMEEMINYGSGAMTIAQMYEFEAYAPATTAIGTVKAVDGSSVFVATNIARDELKNDWFIEASFVINDKKNNKKAEGFRFIYSAYESIFLGEDVINYEDFEVASEGDYVTGILFTNVPEGAEIDVTFTVVEAVFD